MPELTNQMVCDWIAANAPEGKLASDSRRVGAGDVFFAYPGEAGDGRAYIGAAIDAGAAACVHEASRAPMARPHAQSGSARHSPSSARPLR